MLPVPKPVRCDGADRQPSDQSCKNLSSELQNVAQLAGRLDGGALVRYNTSDVFTRDGVPARRVQGALVSSRKLSTRLSLAIAAVLVAAPALIAGGLAPPAAAAAASTAWQNGAFQVNAGGVVSRSDVVLGQPNTANTQSLPLGNGSLGVAEWAAGGFTAQLNRSDTMPNRLSPGQLNIPGLTAMTSASNFTGTLDLYNGVLHRVRRRDDAARRGSRPARTNSSST